MKHEAMIYAQYHYTCVYCGYDGRTFDSYMQLNIDHVFPVCCGGSGDPKNLVVACGSCNKIMGNMRFNPDQTREEIIALKRQRVAESRQGYYTHWIKNVAPQFLSRPLAAIPPLS